MPENIELLELMSEVLTYLTGRRLIILADREMIPVIEAPTGYRAHAHCNGYEVHAFDFNRLDEEKQDQKKVYERELIEKKDSILVQVTIGDRFVSKRFGWYLEKKKS